MSLFSETSWHLVLNFKEVCRTENQRKHTKTEFMVNSVKYVYITELSKGVPVVFVGQSKKNSLSALELKSVD